MGTALLAWALADFAGYVAVDALSAGPFCILSAVDNRRDKRLLYDVLDYNPSHDDIRACLGRLTGALDVRDLTPWGGTTDGSQRYPAPPPLREVFGEVPQQICECHGVKEIVTAVCSAGASERKGVAAKQPPLPKGRPSTKATKKAARKKKRGEQ